MMTRLPGSFFTTPLLMVVLRKAKVWGDDRGTTEHVHVEAHFQCQGIPNCPFRLFLVSLHLRVNIGWERWTLGGSRHSERKVGEKVNCPIRVWEFLQWWWLKDKEWMLWCCCP